MAGLNLIARENGASLQGTFTEQLRLGTRRVLELRQLGVIRDRGRDHFELRLDNARAVYRIVSRDLFAGQFGCELVYFEPVEAGPE